jgi:hypothetical protein
MSDIAGRVIGGDYLLPVEKRYAITVPLASEFIGISKTRVYELLAAGDLEGKVLHGRRVVLVESLMRMLGKAPSAKRGRA